MFSNKLQTCNRTKSNFVGSTEPPTHRQIIIDLYFQTNSNQVIVSGSLLNLLQIMV